MIVFLSIDPCRVSGLDFPSQFNQKDHLNLFSLTTLQADNLLLHNSKFMKKTLLHIITKRDICEEGGDDENWVDLTFQKIQVKKIRKKFYLPK